MVAELTFSSDPRLMKVLRAVIHFFAAQVGFPEDETMNLMLAADEACTNIIRHGYGGQRNQTISLRVESLPDRLEIVFEDRGVAMPADRLKVQPVPCDERELKPGGLGTLLITSIMDRVDYESEPRRGNRLSMTKHLAKESKP